MEFQWLAPCRSRHRSAPPWSRRQRLPALVGEWLIRGAVRHLGRWYVALPQHFIHYLPRRIVVRLPGDPKDPWFAETQDLTDGFARPMYHTTRRSIGPATTIVPGDSIWIVSQVFSPWGGLRPAIDARIDVARIEERERGRRRFVAARSSSWFPMADATPILKRLHTRTADGRLSKLIGARAERVGHSLQSMRLLESGDLLEKWSRTLNRTQPHFISYRICDGTRAAFRIARELLSKGEVVFWDRWCLPRRLAERRELASDRALDKYLMSHLRGSKLVWGIESKAYFAKDSYATKEPSTAIRIGNYRAVPVMPIQKRPTRR